MCLNEAAQFSERRFIDMLHPKRPAADSFEAGHHLERAERFRSSKLDGPPLGGRMSQGDQSVLPSGGFFEVPIVEVRRENVVKFWQELKKLRGEG